MSIVLERGRVYSMIILDTLEHRGHHVLTNIMFVILEMAAANGLDFDVIGWYCIHARQEHFS
jgi:hypothetical protein